MDRDKRNFTDNELLELKEGDNVLTNSFTDGKNFYVATIEKIEVGKKTKKVKSIKLQGVEKEITDFLSLYKRI